MSQPVISEEAARPGGAGRLLFVADLDSQGNDGGLLREILFRVKLLASDTRTVSMLCLYSAEKDQRELQACFDADERAHIDLYFLNKNPSQLAPGMMSQACVNAYLFYEWLKARADCFDWVHAVDAHNALYFALVARKLGMRFGDLKFVHICSAPLLLQRDLRHKPVEVFSDLAQIFMERQSAAMSDFVLARSHRMLTWLDTNGYRITERQRIVLPPLVPAGPADDSREPIAAPGPGLVYFGDLTSLPELLIYLDAFRRMLRSCRENAVDTAGSGILFVSSSKPSKKVLRSIRGLFGPSGLKCQMIQADAFEFIASGAAAGRLALLPAGQPGLDLVTISLLQAGIQVLGFLDSGFEELADNLGQSVCVRLHPHDIAQAMTRWLTSAATASPGLLDANAVLEKYRHWYAETAVSEVVRAQSADLPKPLVSVCIAHFNRPLELSQALDSVCRLTYPNLEIIVVDDGSTDPLALDYLRSLEDAALPWKIRVFTQPNLYLGASRNLAARNARGKYLLFMDDDNMAKPEEVDVLVAAAEHSKADILTCFADAFLRNEEITSDINRNRIVFTGADIAAGFFRNPYGDSNCLVRRESFEALGGFSEDYKIGRDDQEFFSRAILRGFGLFVVPEALYWYKINTSRMRQTQFSQYAGLRRVARPYFEESGFDAHWQDMLRYAQGLSAQKSGITGGGLRRYAQNNRLRMIAYAFPGLYKWLRPLLRRL